MQDDGSRWLPVWLGVFLMAVSGTLAVGWSPWALLLVPAIGLQVRRPSRVPEGLDALGTVPPPGPAFRVRLETYEGHVGLGRGFLLGTDHGVVTFVAGWLHFAGRRTEFSLRRRDAVDLAQWKGEHRVLLRHAGDVSLRCLDPEDDAPLARALGVWFRTTPEPDGESVLPPAAIHASGIVRAWRDALVAAAATVAGGVFAFRLIGTGMLFAFMPTSFETFRRVRRAHALARGVESGRRIGPRKNSPSNER